MEPKKTLLECGCVPSAMIHFSCSTEIDHLKPDLKKKIVSGCQASIAAYLVRYVFCRTIISRQYKYVLFAVERGEQL